jgi:CIC family chloride channel protein
MGACLGSVYGFFVHHFFPNNTASPGAYALVGMAAMFSGASRATLTTIVMLFEMTLDYKIILPLMFACVIADGISWAIAKESIYTKKIKRKGLDIDLDMEVNQMYTHCVNEIMTTQPVTIRITDQPSELFKHLSETGYHNFTVVDQDHVYCGTLSLNEIRNQMNSASFAEMIEKTGDRKLYVAHPKTSIKRAFDILTRNRLRMIPIVEPGTNRLKGILSKSDFFKVHLLDSN